MLRKIFVLLSLVFIAACSPKDAEVESKPFEEPVNDGFETMSMQQPLTLNRASWFFWKRPEDMSTAMRLGAGLEMIQKNMLVQHQERAQLQQNYENYLVESLGQDNKEIWEKLFEQHLVNHDKQLQVFLRLDAERAKPTEEQDADLIASLEQELEALKKEGEEINSRIQVVEQQSGVADFGIKIREISEKIVGVDYKIKELQKAAQTYQQQLASLVELIPDPPKLLLQETSNGLFIELIDFKNQDVPCNTTVGTIRNVLYKKHEGYIEFTAICKQPDWSDASKLVSYKVIIEKIPTAQNLLLSGNMARCVDLLPNVGKCEGGLSTGVIKYQQ